MEVKLANILVESWANKEGRKETYNAHERSSARKESGRIIGVKDARADREHGRQIEHFGMP